MSKPKKPAEIQQSETEQLHPQILRTKHSDLMSEQTVITVTIPPLGKMEPGFHEALKGDAFKSDRPLNSWTDIQARVGFDEFEATEKLIPKHQGHYGPVQRQHPERFSEEAFRQSAYFSIKSALEAIEELSDEHRQIVLNSVAPRCLQAGMALAEGRLRENHYDDVAVRRRVRSGLQQWSAEEAEKKEKEMAQVMKSMTSYIKRGRSISNAARLSYEKDGHGASPEANRRLYYRRR